jgi:hypothetical protein
MNLSVLIKTSILIGIHFLFLGIGARAQTNWKLIKNENDIQVYTRKVPNYDIEEIKIISKFQSSVQGFLALLLDVPVQSEYIYGCTFAKMVREEKPNQQMFYQQIYLPWPFSNRDGYFLQHIYREKNSATILVQTEASPSAYPKELDYIRIPELRASWKITPISNSELIAEYQVLLKPGGEVPAWLINLFIDKAPYQTILKMKELVKKSRYQKAQIPELK